MGSFAVVFFFSVTGLTLNHPQWFADQQRTETMTGTLDASWVQVADPALIRKLDVVEFLRNTHGIHGAMGDFQVDDGQCTVSFKGPGYAADVFIDRTTGRYELTESRMGFGAIINDLHKGRDSGDLWKWLIDASAVLLVFVSATGLVLLWFLHKHRVAGLLSLVAGSVLTWLIYVIWVP